MQIGNFRIGVPDDADHWLYMTRTDDGDGRVIQVARFRFCSNLSGLSYACFPFRYW